MPPKNKLEDMINIVSDLAELEKVVLENQDSNFKKEIHLILIDAIRRILVVKDGN